ncbi:uncharacterized protein OCT59_024717 [Rhizophagus irregularis]|uniref:uncharacterized protein n=1 Tax=Rhizophagus irregularis TaxID=588596 RepID=UPI00331B5EDD|nr:hypothetical protein OCT59_024717 [Rhizophagus irregularis]
MSEIVISSTWCVIMLPMAMMTDKISANLILILFYIVNMELPNKTSLTLNATVGEKNKPDNQRNQINTVKNLNHKERSL